MFESNKNQKLLNNALKMTCFFVKKMFFFDLTLIIKEKKIYATKIIKNKFLKYCAL